jgi:hypothetical protein
MILIVKKIGNLMIKKIIYLKDKIFETLRFSVIEILTFYV